MSVNLGGRNIRMPQHLLNRPQVSPALHSRRSAWLDWQTSDVAARMTQSSRAVSGARPRR
jgi:hypothetical protein